MTSEQQIIAGLLIRVARRQITLAQLKERAALGRAHVERVGAANVESRKVAELDILENTIARIEAALAVRLAQRNN